MATRGSVPAAKPSRRRDILELSVGYTLIILVLWTPRPWQRILYATATGFLVTVLWRSFQSWSAMGLRTVNLLRSLWIAGLALLLAGMSVALAIHLDTLHMPDTPLAFLQRYWGYALWAFCQQILLQNFFLERFLRLLPGKPTVAAILAASVFALAHVPSPILAPATLVWGLIACLLFLRYRNLYPLALSHAILGICLAITLPGPVIHNMRVGLGYLTYNHRFRHRSH
jgi:hypothetical protein